MLCIKIFRTPELINKKILIPLEMVTIVWSVTGFMLKPISACIGKNKALTPKKPAFAKQN